jgi:hypothetical protein
MSNSNSFIELSIRHHLAIRQIGRDHIKINTEIEELYGKKQNNQLFNFWDKLINLFIIFFLM